MEDKNPKECKCGRPGEVEAHSCPYASEINGNNDPEYCNCCEACETACCEDI